MSMYTDAQNQSGQYDDAPAHRVQQNDPQNDSQHPLPKDGGGNPFKYITALLIIAAVAVVAYYVVFRSGVIKTNAGYSSLESAGSLTALGNVVSYGYNSIPDLNASYSGIASLSSSIFGVSVPFTMTVQKYGNNSADHISIYLKNIADILGSLGSSSSSTQYLNLSLYYLNGTSYICSVQAAGSYCANESRQPASPGSSYSSIGGLFSQLQSSLQLSILNKTLTGASYSGNACTLFSEKALANVNAGTEAGIMGSLASANTVSSNASAQAVPSIPTFPIYLTTCLSNQYYGIPFNISIDLPEVTIDSSGSSLLSSNVSLSLSVAMNAQYMNTNVSQQEVDVLPYPIVSVAAIPGIGNYT